MVTLLSKTLILGATELVYSIEDVLSDEMIQSGDSVALPPGGHLKSVFFSEDGVRGEKAHTECRIPRYSIQKECCWC